jgi:hypothetical protein
MEKMKQTSNQTIYGVEIPSMLMSEKHYLLATINKSMEAIALPLSEIFWDSLQIRTFPASTVLHKFQKHKFIVKREPIYYSKLQIKNRDKKISTYTSDLSGVEISLLHTKDLEFEYPNEGTLISALETYQTIVQLKL